MMRTSHKGTLFRRAKDPKFRFPLAVVPEVFKVSIGMIGRQESIVVEKQPAVFEFDSFNRCHCSASRSAWMNGSMPMCRQVFLPMN